MKTVTYKATGIVLGNFWGGGSGSYPARPLNDTTLEGLMKQANDGLDGSLDSGMGYESLIGAMLNITTKTEMMFEDKLFTNKETETVFIGELTEAQQDFLMECSFY
jgi:hypothetical protein